MILTMNTINLVAFMRIDRVLSDLIIRPNLLVFEVYLHDLYIMTQITYRSKCAL